MITKAKARELILDLFQEEALVIGGLAAVHNLDEDLVWRLMKNFDALLTKTLERVQESDGAGRNHPKDEHLKVTPHPAIEDFLLKLRRA